MDTQDGDERATELETLEAIYPEIQYPDRAREPFTFEIELPIQPETPVTVIFPTSAVGNDVAVGGAGGATAGGGVGAVDGDNDSLNVSHLPSLRLRMTLPEGYPTDRPPVVHISSDPQWLPAGTVSRLEADVIGLWEDVGQDMVAFAYIDHLRRAADDVFDAITPEGTLEVNAQHKLAVLDYDIKAKKEAFEKETFECGVCLDPKKGSKCHKMLDCAHIFCLQCLQDFYNDAITEGNISVVRCLAPNCAKERADAMAKVGKRSRKPNTAVSPSELLLIGVAEDTVKRYVALKYKTELESDKNTIYCPRQWCSGAARSKKHKKPSGLDFGGHGEGKGGGSGSDSSDDESLVGEEDDNDEKREERAKKRKKKKAKARFNRADLLAVCEDCGFAFCSQCLLSWHGEFVICTPKRDVTELTEEEKASLEYVKLHTSPCPTCNAPAQKTQGCNHMICSRCESHFCYLCSAWLDPNNPYQHYNSALGGKVTSCYMRLWELEGGDGNDVGLGFVGGGGPPGPAAAAAAAAAPMFDVEDAEAQVAALGAFGDSDTEDDEPRDQQQPQPAPNDGPAVLAREGPLVLRLMGGGGQQQPAANAAPRRQGAAAAAGRGQANAHRGGAAAAARGRGRGRGGGRDGQAGAAQAPARGGGGGGHGRGDAQQRNNNVANPARGRRRAAGAAPAPAPAPAPVEGQEGAQADADGNGNIGLDAVQEAWVRNFVRMALIDAEDELGDSSDDDGDGIAFFAIR